MIYTESACFEVPCIAEGTKGGALEFLHREKYMSYFVYVADYSAQHFKSLYSLMMRVFCVVGGQAGGRGEGQLTCLITLMISTGMRISLYKTRQRRYLGGMYL